MTSLPLSRWLAMSALSLSLPLAGCGGALLETTQNGEDLDHSHAVTFEGDSVVQELRGEGVSLPRKAETPFIRLGVLWDAVGQEPLQVRTSADGETWSDWADVTTVFAEETMHAGHVDVAGDSAQHFQWRLSRTLEVPTFVGLEPIEALATPMGEPPPENDEEEELVQDRAAGEAETLGTDLGQLGQGLAADARIHLRREWNARAPKCITRVPNPWRVAIHHTVTPTNDSMTPPQRLRQIQAYHMDSRGYCDIAYNFLVSRDGRIWRGRGREVMGGHVYNNNDGNIGVSFMGDYSSTPATAAQVCNAGRLLAFFKRREAGVSLDRNDVRGHRSWALPGHGTACPGNALFNQIDDILAKAKNGC